MTSLSTSRDNPSTSFDLKGERIVIATVFVSFLLFSAIQSPVPGVNEPHYLAKAKHFWNAEWCRGDFFLKSVNAHDVFFRTVGWLTRWCTLEQTAWAGRAIALLLLAIGWTKLISRILPGRWSPLWTAWVFLALTAIGGATRKPFLHDIEFYAFNLSGEWIVGGIEGKVLSYGLIFWAMALFMEGRWLPASMCAGLSISFHPVVGIWSLLAGLFAGAAVLIIRRRGDVASAGTSRYFSQAVLSAIVMGLCAMPGLLPAIRLLGDGDLQTTQQAEFIQVFVRLAHHLDPMTFKIGDYVSYLFLILFWFSARGQFKRHTPQERFFTWFVFGTILIAVAGLLIGLRMGLPQEMLFAELRTKLLKFYPFRLADAFVLIAASVVLVGLIRKWSENNLRFRFGPSVQFRDWLCWPIFGLVMLVALLLPSTDRNPSRMEEKQLADWKHTCRWISQNTPEEALFYTPNESWAFKWYAQRAEFVSYKDCPQDAAGIVEWDHRLRFIRDWEQKQRAVGLEHRSLNRLYESTGITHLVMHCYEPFDSKPIYWNDSYKVYEIPEAILEFSENE